MAASACSKTVYSFEAITGGALPDSPHGNKFIDRTRKATGKAPSKRESFHRSMMSLCTIVWSRPGPTPM